jgi:hypothetical protein
LFTTTSQILQRQQYYSKQQAKYYNKIPSQILQQAGYYNNKPDIITISQQYYSKQQAKYYNKIPKLNSIAGTRLLTIKQTDVSTMYQLLY